MKRMIRTAFLAMATMAFFSSCKKDKDDDNTGNGKTDLITNGSWKISAVHEKLGENPWVDITAQEYEDCELDDRIQFSKPNIVTTDEGATKCDPSNPQTDTGTWKFVNGEQEIELAGEEFHIDELTATSLKISVSGALDGFTYIYRISLVH